MFFIEITLPDTTRLLLPHSSATTKLRAKYDPMASFFFSPSQETLINFIWRNSQIFLATAANVLPSSSFLLIIPNYSQQFFVKKKYLIRSWATRILILTALYASVSSYPWNVIIIILTILNYFLRFK